MSGIDPWDLTICAKLSHIEQICDKLLENFNLQPESVQRYYHSRLLSIRMNLYRLSPQGEFKAADCNAMLMLHTVYSAFKGLLRTAEGMASIVEKNTITFEKIKSTIFSGQSEF